jgi:hypothetical protein
MQKSVIYQAHELSPEMRRAAEVLLGGTLDEDEMITVRASKGRILKEAPTGEVREDAFRRLFGRIDQTAKRSEGVREEDVDAAIDEAVDYVRHHRGWESRWTPQSSFAQTPKLRALPENFSRRSSNKERGLFCRPFFWRKFSGCSGILVCRQSKRRPCSVHCSRRPIGCSLYRRPSLLRAERPFILRAL